MLRPSLQEFKHEIYLLRKIEHFNAEKNGRVSKHMKKWYGINLETPRGTTVGDGYIGDYIELMDL